MASNEQIKRIYGLGAGLGIVGKNREDMLHELIFGITGKNSVKSLDDSEVQKVQTELIDRLRLGSPAHPAHKKRSQTAEGNGGMATKEQQALCWRYCYRLKELDPDPASAAVADRLCGAIRKVCNTNMVTKKEPFRCVTQKDCSELIEMLKRYVNSAERKAAKRSRSE